ncbi:MAG: squalene/phytoene synthase family protein [Bacteroidota bacterium]
MKESFDEVSADCSKITTNKYSTSFSLGIKFLAKKFHKPIYGIYGFVRIADEIVDSFHGFDKEDLLHKFRNETYEAIDSGISLNPILNSFQHVVRKYNIGRDLIDTFLSSMEMDLTNNYYERELYNQYILGSAEVVGLMCLKVFCEGDEKLYESFKHPAMKLGSAFQKVNFLRDMKADNEQLGRTYFPGINFNSFRNESKIEIEKEIQKDFAEALKGIKGLPHSSRSGVYLAYYYYTALFKKIKSLPAEKIMTERIRVSNSHKFGLMLNSMVKHHLNIL